MDTKITCVVFEFHYFDFYLLFQLSREEQTYKNSNFLLLLPFLPMLKDNIDQILITGTDKST